MNAPSPSHPKRAKVTRQQKRWNKSIPFEQLPPTRRFAMRLVDGVEDAIVVVHLSALGFVLFAHLLAPVRGFLAFVVGHQALVRDYWLIERMEDPEYGMWPGVLTALGGDAVAMALVVLPAVLPFVIARHYIVRDEHPLGEVLREYLVTSALLLLASYLVGAIAGTFFVLVTAGAAGLFSDIGGLLAPVGSGILLTDLLFATWMWWSDRASAPRGTGKLARLAMGLVGSLLLIAGAQLALRVEGHVEAEDVVTLYLRGDRIEHPGTRVGSVFAVAKATRRHDFGEGKLVAPGESRLYAHGWGQPFFLDRAPFYHSPPDDLSLEGGVIHFSYQLHPWSVAPRRSTRQVTLTPDEGKGFYDQYREVVDTADQLFWGHALEVRSIEVSEGVSFGLLYTSHDASFYALAVGHRISLLEVASPATELALHEMPEPVERVAVVLHDLGGATVLANDQPVWVIEVSSPKTLAAAMVRRPKLKDGDRAVLGVRIDAAKRLAPEAIAEARRRMKPPF